MGEFIFRIGVMVMFAWGVPQDPAQTPGSEPSLAAVMPTRSYYLPRAEHAATRNVSRRSATN
jgi:hypothetical protein